MTFASTRSAGSGWRLPNLTASIFQLVAQVQAHRRHRQTEKMLESLPAELRKDIGWPASDATDAAARSRR